MLRSLQLKNVGPAKEMSLDPIAPRFNLITGDNGLGKSFLLETAWWALTRTWHETPAVPTDPDEATIRYCLDDDNPTHETYSHWDPHAQEWMRNSAWPPQPAIVVYVRIDGSFSVWDPARNFRLLRKASEAETPAAYQFVPDAVLDGLKRPSDKGGKKREELLCAGLIDDWTRWQDNQDARFKLLEALLAHISPDGQPLTPGEQIRRSFSDPTRLPTISMPYGQDVPITYAPAGVQRMAKLAYLLSWAFSEHREISQLLGQPMSEQIIVLFDEPETHLHPRWQRTVLPSLARAIESWTSDIKPQVQLLVATHSPLVLASMEPEFDAKRDALWKLDLVGDEVQLERDEWHMRGDVNRWLTSEVFDLGEAMSTEAQEALREAQALMRAERPDVAEVKRVDELLVKRLPEMDPFFVRWRYYMMGSLHPAGAQASAEEPDS